MTKRIAALAIAGIAALAGPAFAMGEGGCNWGAAFTSASADADTTPIRPIAPDADDARG